MPWELNPCTFHIFLLVVYRLIIRLQVCSTEGIRCDTRCRFQRLFCVYIDWVTVVTSVSFSSFGRSFHGASAPKILRFCAGSGFLLPLKLG